MKENNFYQQINILSCFNDDIKLIIVKNLCIGLYTDDYINPYSYCWLTLPEVNIFKDSIKQKIKNKNNLLFSRY